MIIIAEIIKHWYESILDEIIDSSPLEFAILMYDNEILSHESYDVMMQFHGVFMLMYAQAQTLIQLLIEDMRDPLKYEQFFEATEESTIVYELSFVG